MSPAPHKRNSTQILGLNEQFNVMYILGQKTNCPKSGPMRKTKCWSGKERRIGQECPQSVRYEEQPLGRDLKCYYDKIFIFLFQPFSTKI